MVTQVNFHQDPADVLFPMKRSHHNRKQPAAALAAALVSLCVSRQSTAEGLFPWSNPQNPAANEITSLVTKTDPSLHQISLPELTESTTDAAIKAARQQISLTNIPDVADRFWMISTRSLTLSDLLPNGMASVPEASGLWWLLASGLITFGTALSCYPGPGSRGRSFCRRRPL